MIWIKYPIKAKEYIEGKRIELTKLHSISALRERFWVSLQREGKGKGTARHTAREPYGGQFLYLCPLFASLPRISPLVR